MTIKYEDNRNVKKNKAQPDGERGERPGSDFLGSGV
jgi:hypothetical protein